jgi:hypothetical protein
MPVAYLGYQSGVASGHPSFGNVHSLLSPFPRRMEYHVKLYDTFVGTRWTAKDRDKHLGFAVAPPRDLKEHLNKRHGGDENMLDGVLAIQRRIIRYDHSQGVPVYYIRFAQVRYSTGGFFPLKLTTG